MKNNITKKHTILIIGNGFDLAHGMKTNFKDYLEWELKDTSGMIKDDLKSSLEISDKDVLGGINEGILCKNTLLVSLIFLFKFNEKWSNRNFNWNQIEDFIGGLFTNEENKFKDEWKTIEKISLNKSGNRERKLKYRPNGIDNDPLGWIKDELISNWDEIIKRFSIYLKGLESDESLEEINRVFGSSESVEVINFNFTNTIEKYVKEYETTKTKVYYVHGNINDNNIVLGSENIKYDNQYSKLNKTFLKNKNNIKTFSLKNVLCTEHSNMIIHYEVIVFGHSINYHDSYVFNYIFEKLIKKLRETNINENNEIKIISNKLDKIIYLLSSSSGYSSDYDKDLQENGCKNIFSKWTFYCKDEDDKQEKMLNLLRINDSYFNGNEKVIYEILKEKNK